MQPQLSASIEKETRKQFANGIPAYGTDALRFTFAVLATTGRHIRFDVNRVEGYKHFTNKIWNATRYVLMNTENIELDWDVAITLSPADRWIISEWQRVKEKIENFLAQYRFDLSAQAIYEFIWNEYCDWYLEFSKPLLQSNDPAVVLATRRTLLSVLEEFIRVIHPFMPYISESIWQTVAPLCRLSGNTVMLQPYPPVLSHLVDEAAQADIAWLKAMILAIRNIRGEMNIAPSKQISLLLKQGSPADSKRLALLKPLLCTLAKIHSISFIGDQKQPHDSKACATALVDHLMLLIPLEGLVDIDAECTRLHKTIQKLQVEETQLNQKLSNSSFIEKAPAELVITLKNRLEEIHHNIEKLQKTLNVLASQKN